MSEQATSSTESAPYLKPLPEITAEAKPFWDAAKEHRLLIQRSKKNGKAVFYPRTISPYGPLDELEWFEASGRGTVYSYTVARRPTAPQWADDPPLIIAIVQLEEGPRMTTNLVGLAPEDVRIGMGVRAVYEDVTPEVTLVKFGPPPLATATVAESAEPPAFIPEPGIPPSPNVDVEPIPEAI